MKKNYLLLSVSVFALLLLLNTEKVNSKISSPPAGSAGDPFTNASCSQNGCHGGATITPTANDLTLTIGTNTPTTPLDASFEYTGGVQYNIGFLINAFTGRYGFQMVALDAANAQAGTMTVTNAATTKINTSPGTGSRQYMGHLNASSTKNWTFRWTAPAATTGPVTFYYSYATEDNDDNPGTNVIYKSSVTINPAASAIENINTKVEALQVFPNPVTNEVGVSFNLLETENVSAELYSLDGRLMTGFTAENAAAGKFSKTLNVSEITAGVYLLKLNVGGASATQKIIKQ
ncbi:MAG: T9SS type A sorting domain-containing protein [Bacteroidetes bacterium]|nr:T9SS type A sorting domain-containing protein [Bacteroidota bacterium]MBK8658601.1 T9SS type A sorting domain-containing protein [Bacteroidota bacterium]